MNNKFVFVFLVFLIFVSGVSALGVTPARTTIAFEPGLEREVSFSVLNSEHEDASYVVYATGELNESVYLSEAEFTMSASEESKTLSYNLKLPSDLEPGVRTADVVVLKVPEKDASGGAFIGATVGVATQVYVYVPYPGKYADLSLNIQGSSVGEDVYFVIPVVSRGELDLVSVYANVDIYNKLGEKVGNFNTAEIEVLSGQREELVHSWSADVSAGVYRAVATIVYDGETRTLEGNFNVGSESLELEQIKVNDFALGEIAKFEMLLSNNFGEDIVGAYTQTHVFNSEGEVMADFKSPTIDIPAMEKKVLTSYWDTGGVHKGSYDASVFLRYGENSVQKDLELNVYEDRLEIVGVGYVISERSSGSGDGLLVWFLVIVVGVLILVNVLWFLVLRKKLRRRFL